jgi:hypothetical protein
MKKLKYIALGLAGLGVLLIFLPWIQANSGYSVAGHELNSGKMGITTFFFSMEQYFFNKIALGLMIINMISSFGHLYGWISAASSAGAKNVIEGLQFSYFVYLLCAVAFSLVIWEIKLRAEQIMNETTTDSAKEVVK